MEGRVSKKKIAQIGNICAILGFLLIVASGIARSLGIFYPGIMLLGFGTGIATVANLSLMYNLTVRDKVGLYIGAWGFSNGLSRLVGLPMAGVVADVATKLSGNALNGYLIVFGLEALMLFIAAIMLHRIDVQAFRRKFNEPSLVEKVAIATEWESCQTSTRLIFQTCIRMVTLIKIKRGEKFASPTSVRSSERSG